MSSLKYFGTDGIRGKLGKNPITPEFFLKLGWAVGKILGSSTGSKKIIVGKDTRISGYLLEYSLGAGLLSAGLSPMFTGSIPTPAIAYLTKKYKAKAGIVISASHNPYYDNGIKFFSIDGSKISKKLEEKIEEKIKKPLVCVISEKLKKINRIYHAKRLYINHCKKMFPNNKNLNGLKIILDCANGSAYKTAYYVLSELGAEVIKLGCSPNGFNINKNCGTVNVKILKKIVIKEKADIGVALDGDGDRVILIDHYGNKVNGDKILYIIVRDALNNGKLQGGAVGTEMSNISLELEFKKIGVPFIRTNIGDRYVYEKLKELNWKFGAESSGHVILLNKTTTGDGIIASLEIFSVMIRNKMTLYDLHNKIKLIPQITKNIYFSNKNKDPFLFKNIVNSINKIKIKKTERILLRKSGTEPLIRIMVESLNKKKNEKIIKNIISIIKNTINLY